MKSSHQIKISYPDKSQLHNSAKIQLSARFISPTFLTIFFPSPGCRSLFLSFFLFFCTLQSRTRPKEVRNLSESTKLQTIVCECAKTIPVPPEDRPKFPLTENGNDVISEEKTRPETEEKSPERNTVECQAIESVGVSRIFCQNPVTDFSVKRRCNPKLPASYYCETHVERLKLHQACVHCGEFCGHGLFLMCRPLTRVEPHLFHKNCYSALKNCPHCNSTERPFTVLLKLSMDRVPFHLLQTVSKMSFVKTRKAKMSDLILKRHEGVTYKLPNGNIISSDGEYIITSFHFTTFRMFHMR